MNAVQEAVAAKGQYDCTEAMVVTNSFYTTAAAHLARKNHVVLWNRNDLATRLLRTRAKESSDTNEEPAETHSNQTTLSSDPTPGALPTEPLPGVETCATCANVLTPGERAYCVDHAQRFAGKMLCFRHQRGVRRS